MQPRGETGRWNQLRIRGDCFSTWIHFEISSRLLLRQLIHVRSPFRNSADMTAVRCRRGFTYTTTPGLARLKSTSSCSRNSRIPLLEPLVLQYFRVMRCSWQTYRPMPFCSGARGKPDLRNRCELDILLQRDKSSKRPAPSNHTAVGNENKPCRSELSNLL